MKKATEKKLDTNPVSFEKAIERLEEIVNALDQNKIPLDHALDMFQEGIMLVKYCNKLLDLADAKVKVLLDDSIEDLKVESIASGENH